MTLDRAPAGVLLEIAGFSTLPDWQEQVRRLKEMGVATGDHAMVQHRALSGDPIAVDFDGTLIGLRLAQAALVEVRLAGDRHLSQAVAGAAA